MAGTALERQRRRFASRRAAGWQPLPVLTCQVVPAGWRFLVGCSRGNVAFPHGMAADGRHSPLGTAETIGFASWLPGDSPFVFHSVRLFPQRGGFW
jgi:hypothetical protein